MNRFGRHWAAFALTSCLLFVSSVPAQKDASKQWPSWRGPVGDGHAIDKGTPVKWDAKSIVWKTPLKGSGQSAPVIWEDRIFLTSAVDEGKQRLVFCIDRKNGKVLWEQVAWKGTPNPTHRLNGWASSTCATDGERVYASFGKAGLHCYTVAGKHLWSRELGQFICKNKRGTAASLLLVDNLVIFNGDSESDPFLFGIDKMTGKTVWKVDRPKAEGYSSPILIEAKGRKEVVLNGAPYVAAYDPATGKRLWSCKSFAGRGEPTPAPANGLLYVVNGQPGDVYAVKPGGSGDVTKSHMAWHTPRRNGRDQPSPIVVNNHLFVSNIAGVLICYDATTGKELWKERFSPTKLMAAPIAANGKAYFLNESGETIVLEPADTMKIVARNSIGAKGEMFRAAPVPFRGQIFLRSHGTLYCIGKK